MSRFPFLLLGTLALGAAGCGSTTSWDPLAEVPAPVSLPDGQDTLSASAYYHHGERILESSPQRAAEAFYWAGRLDPSWAAPLFGRRIALLMSNPSMFDLYLSDSRRLAGSPGVLRLDSLYLKALTLNPFPQRRLEARAFRSLMMFRVKRYLRRQGRTQASAVSDADLAYYLEEYLREAPPATRGWVAYSEGRFGDAARHYRRAVDQSPDIPYLRADLARALFMTGRYAEAGEEMAMAVAAMDRRDEEALVRVYESRALFEHSIGLIHEQQGNVPGARSSYAAALEQDLSFHPAHLRLAEIALAAGDTATAVNEVALATEIQPDDPVVRYHHGRLLAGAGDLDGAALQLRAAIELEPRYALPYGELAGVLDRLGRTGEAAAQYRAFLERAAARAPGVDRARARLAEIQAGATPEDGA